MLRLTYLRIGQCSAPAWGAGMGGLSRMTFPALAALIETEDYVVLVDTGYGPAFFNATDPFPARVYRWLTPVTLSPEQHLPKLLPRNPDLVFLTHMHGDHVAGLADLPADTPVVASDAAINHLRSLGDWAAARAACPAGLRDMILDRAPQPIEARRTIQTGLPAFATGHDLMGDGRLIAIPLPGHGIGQTGIWIPEIAHLLIADAAYSNAALRQNRMPPRPVLRRLGDPAAYAATFAALRRLLDQRPDITIIPSHCPEVASWA